MGTIGELKIVLKDCPVNPVEGEKMRAMLQKALRKEFGEVNDQMTATGPELIDVLLKDNQEHASAIIWSLMNVGMNMLVAKAKVEKPKEKVQ